MFSFYINLPLLNNPIFLSLTKRWRLVICLSIYLSLILLQSFYLLLYNLKLQSSIMDYVSLSIILSLAKR